MDLISILYNYLFHTWQELSKLQESQLPKRCQESNSLPKRLLENLHQLPLVSRNPTDLNQEQLLLEKSENIKNPLIYWSENSPSKEWSDKLLTNGDKNSGSNPQLFWPSKRLLKHTSSLSLKIPTFALSMPRESPSWPEICNSLKESEETDSDFYCIIVISYFLKLCAIFQTILYIDFSCYYSFENSSGHFLQI